MAAVRAALGAALLACAVAPAVASAAPCRVHMDPPEVRYTPWGSPAYVIVDKPEVVC